MLMLKQILKMNISDCYTYQRKRFKNHGYKEVRIKKTELFLTLPFLSPYDTCVYFLNFLLNNPSPGNPESMFFEGKYYIAR